ncbi:FUN14 family-domain-containing protein [Spinellus fusiger]|nr:FUN14 family-domain-containing protein [Spinellus fusiger]
MYRTRQCLRSFNASIVRLPYGTPHVLSRPAALQQQTVASINTLCPLSRVSTATASIKATSTSTATAKPLLGLRGGVAMTTKVLGLAAVSSASRAIFPKQPIECQGSIFSFGSTTTDTGAVKSIAQDVALSVQGKKQPFIRKGEISFGAFLGICTGYLIKKVGKLFVLTIGAGFTLLQYLSYKGYISIHWDRLEGSYRQTLDVDGDGRVTRRDLVSTRDRLMGLLTHNLQFKSTFLAGFYIGIQYI